jgi:hypothetical protein
MILKSFSLLPPSVFVFRALLVGSTPKNGDEFGMQLTSTHTDV